MCIHHRLYYTNGKLYNSTIYTCVRYATGVECLNRQTVPDISTRVLDMRHVTPVDLCRQLYTMYTIVYNVYTCTEVILNSNIGILYIRY